ncbi:MAG: hypothetical protein WCA32_15210 [Chromatiaceae bacterium]|jgi:hypothetical protein
MITTWQDHIYRKREELASILHVPMASLARECLASMDDRGRLNETLIACLADIPHRAHLYVLRVGGIQICDTVTAEGLLWEDYGRDLSERPYMKEAMPPWGFLLSDAYISPLTHHPSLTALHVIRSEGSTLGYLAADFDLRDLPVAPGFYDEPAHWQQIKGDPSIRGTVFQQCRVESPLDKNMDQALSILEELLTERGMFQGVVHFSSSRAIAWFLDDPYRYRMLDQEALGDPDICLAYPRAPYPAGALIPQSSIRPIIERMRDLRWIDDTFYLRSAFINVYNGMIGLTFSCDGSHYMPYEEFLRKDMSFWLGIAA